MLPFRLLLAGVLLAFSLAGLTAQSNSVSAVTIAKPSKGFGVLVSLKQGVNGKDFLDTYPELVQRFGLVMQQRVAKTMNIWYIKPSLEANVAEVVEALYRLPEVEMAQKNHIITQRNDTLAPNDPRYNQQWQYKNLGGNGGVVGADISAELAWYVTTGGVTPNGDTIVVAVIDDGMDTTIPDLRLNWWKNRNEIPGNNIDDDANGYIDDFRGWNAYDNNDRIYIRNSWDVSGLHGSAVAGIVGARGNDGSGVAGVNWNVKLMIIAGGGDEAEALAAYDYALQNRLLYDATGGAKGAYVVATNSSWGVDGLFYNDAPLWCAFYDSLGKAGILSAGATVNENWDIEQLGDMPTSCPSDYLIAVTNTKRNDVKETFAGYGTISVDLGAPGEDAYTVDAISGFAGFGGTSGATPHVAGAIALLFSVPNQDFANYAAAYPDSAVLWAKRFILEGVDSNASLRGKSVTEGRLNLFGAIEKMYQYFPDEPVDTVDTTTGPTGLVDVWAAGTKLYPNPAQYEVILELPSSEAVNIRLIGMDGKVLYTQLSQGAARFHHLSVETLPYGVYTLEITNQRGNKAYHRLVKQ